jgi:hypothetical protein
MTRGLKFGVIAGLVILFWGLRSKLPHSDSTTNIQDNRSAAASSKGTQGTSHQSTRIPASIRSGIKDSPITKSSPKIIPLENNISEIIQFRALASIKSNEWITKYSTENKTRGAGPYNLVHLDRLSAIPKQRYSGPRIKDLYHFAIIQRSDPKSTQVYIDQDQNRLVLLTGKVIIKKASGDLALPTGSSVVYVAPETKIQHVKLNPSKNPFDQLEEIKSKNQGITWAHLELIDRMDLPQ